MNEAKPFCISKKEVWKAYKRVKEAVLREPRGAIPRGYSPGRNPKARVADYPSRVVSFAVAGDRLGSLALTTRTQKAKSRG